MSLSSKIAWRNIWLHKNKSIVIGIILFLGAFLMTLGNGIVSGMEKGLENIDNLESLGNKILLEESINIKAFIHHFFNTFFSWCCINCIDTITSNTYFSQQIIFSQNFNYFRGKRTNHF